MKLIGTGRQADVYALDERRVLPVAGVARRFVAAFGRVAGADVRAGLDAALAVRSTDPSLTPGDAARLPEAAALLRFLS